MWNGIKKQCNDEAVETDVVAATLRRLLHQCPVCMGRFSGHSYALLATTVLGEGHTDRAIEFFNALKQHRWRDSIEFQRWEGSRDNAEAYALNCPAGKLALVIIRSPYELYENDEILGYETLSNESSEELVLAIPEHKWKPL